MLINMHEIDYQLLLQNNLLLCKVRKFKLENEKLMKKILRKKKSKINNLMNDENKINIIETDSEGENGKDMNKRKKE